MNSKPPTMTPHTWTIDYTALGPKRGNAVYWCPFVGKLYSRCRKDKGLMDSGCEYCFECRKTIHGNRTFPDNITDKK